MIVIYDHYDSNTVYRIIQPLHDGVGHGAIMNINEIIRRKRILGESTSYTNVDIAPKKTLRGYINITRSMYSSYLIPLEITRAVLEYIDNSTNDKFMYVCAS